MIPDDLLEMLEAMLKREREKALEEAAGACEYEADGDSPQHDYAITQCVRAIRAMKVEP